MQIDRTAHAPHAPLVHPYVIRIACHDGIAMLVPSQLAALGTFVVAHTDCVGTGVPVWVDITTFSLYMSIQCVVDEGRMQCQLAFATKYRMWPLCNKIVLQITNKFTLSAMLSVSFVERALRIRNAQLFAVLRQLIVNNAQYDDLYFYPPQFLRFMHGNERTFADKMRPHGIPQKLAKERDRAIDIRIAKTQKCPGWVYGSSCWRDSERERAAKMATARADSGVSTEFLTRLMVTDIFCLVVNKPELVDSTLDDYMVPLVERERRHVDTKWCVNG